MHGLMPSAAGDGTSGTYPSVNSLTFLSSSGQLSVPPLSALNLPSNSEITRYTSVLSIGMPSSLLLTSPSTMPIAETAPQRLRVKPNPQPNDTATDSNVARSRGRTSSNAINTAGAQP